MKNGHINKRRVIAADRNKPVDVALFPLSITPHASHCLIVIGRIPVRVEHHEPIGSDQI